jgi:hypothetical protein
MSAHSPGHGREPLDLDSTQTMRAISAPELYDSQHPRWYAIQLVSSDKPVNLDTMPRLEAFAAHRLYAIAGKQQDGVTRYALRLGFFPDEASAETICGYLKTFFSSPTVMRVSTAEQERFARPAGQHAAKQNAASSSTRAARPDAAPVPAPARAAAPAVQRPPVSRTPVVANKAAKAPPLPVKAGGSQKLTQRTKTLAEQLLDEAREVQLSRSGKARASEQSGSWLSRLLGGSKR